MSTETTTVTIGEATTVTVTANTGPRGPAGADGGGGGGAGVTDGDKGDITVSASGATWTIDDNTVTPAKLADIATASILGRTTALAGDPEVLTATQVRSLLNVEDGATADQTAAEILTAIKTVDGATSGLDADLLDGNEATAFATAAQGILADSAYQPGDTIPLTDGGTGAQSAAVARTNLGAAPLASPTFTGVPAAPTATAGANSTQIATTAYVDDATSDLALASGEYAVNTVAASGATETLTLAPAHDVAMDANCTFTFPTPSAGHTFLLRLSGAFTPTFPASVDWDSATAPTYATPSMYGFTTLDGGTTWTGTLIASAAA